MKPRWAASTASPSAVTLIRAPGAGTRFTQHKIRSKTRPQYPIGQMAMRSAPGKPGLTLRPQAFMRVSSGSNTAPVPATSTGNSSFMYMTCSSVPGTASSTGR